MPVTCSKRVGTETTKTTKLFQDFMNWHEKGVLPGKARFCETIDYVKDITACAQVQTLPVNIVELQTMTSCCHVPLGLFFKAF